jgi:ankyrin repeat protein
VLAGTAVDLVGSPAPYDAARERIMIALLDWGAQTAAPSGHEPLWNLLIDAKMPAAFARLAALHPAALADRIPYGPTPLSAAIALDRHDVFAFLLTFPGTRLGETFGYGRETALHDAVTAPDRRYLDELLAAKADPNAVDGEGQTPLHWGVKKRAETARLHALLAAGAAVDARDLGGKTPLYLATPDATLIQLLIGAGADVTIADRLGTTPLVKALDEDVSLEGLAALFARTDAAANIADQVGSTPLMHALTRSLPLESLKLLLDHGAAAEARDHAGQTPLMIAVLKKAKVAIIDLLLDHGAVIDDQDAEKRSVVDYAQAQGNIGLIVHLCQRGSQHPLCQPE